MDIKDPVEEESKFVMDAYRYALDNNLDIKNSADVEKILKALRPEKSGDSDVITIMPMLKLAEDTIQADVEKRKSKMPQS